MLELILKRYFWAVNLVALTVAAYLVARGANAFVESALSSMANDPALVGAPSAKPKIPAGAKGAAAGERGRDKSDAPILSRNLFDSEAHPESMPAGDGTTDSGPVGPAEYCIRPASKASGVTLVGLTTASDPGFALVALKLGGDLRFGRIGDTVGDYKLSEVHTHWVCLERGTSLEYVNLFDAGGTGAVATPPIASKVDAGTATPVAGDDADKYIAKTGPDEWSIDAGFLNDQIKNPAKLMTMGRAVPHLVDGKPAGFKLYAIRPSGLYYKLGVRNGDVITSVNGSPLTSIDQALGLFNTMMEARDINLGVERRGTTVNLHYLIR